MSKARIEIPEERYKADLELHDRYLGFSSELLRMALAGMAAIGAMIGWLTHDGRFNPLLTTHMFTRTAGHALGLLACAAGTALAHRFLASDGMYHHFRAIKLLILSEGRGRASTGSEELRKEASKDEQRRNLRFRLAGLLLFGSSLFLIAGIAAVGFAFADLLPRD